MYRLLIVGSISKTYCNVGGFFGIFTPPVERNPLGNQLTNRAIGVTSFSQGKSSFNSAMLPANGSEIAMHATLTMMSIWLLINALVFAPMMPVDKSAR